MRTIHFMNHTGDREVHVDLLPQRERDLIREEFDNALRNGCRAFKVDRADGKLDAPVRSFDDLENRTIIVPPVVGG